MPVKNKTISVKITSEHSTKVIIGVSLKGRGKYDTEEVALLLKYGQKFQRCIVVLHGDGAECLAWRQENNDSIKKYVGKKTDIMDWSSLEGDPECQNSYAQFCEFKRKDTLQSQDFRLQVDASASSYIERHPESTTEEASNFIVQEMAYLTALAKKYLIDKFIYLGDELAAFSATRKYFLLNDYQNLLQWAELKFLSPKMQKNQQPVVNGEENLKGMDDIEDIDKLLNKVHKMVETGFVLSLSNREALKILLDGASQKLSKECMQRDLVNCSPEKSSDSSSRTESPDDNSQRGNSKSLYFFQVSPTSGFVKLSKNNLDKIGQGPVRLPQKFTFSEGSINSDLTDLDASYSSSDEIEAGHESGRHDIGKTMLLENSDSSDNSNLSSSLRPNSR